MKFCHRHLQQRIFHTLQLQHVVRGFLVRLRYLRLRNASVRISSWWKGKLKRRLFLQLRSQTVIAQTSIRACLAQRACARRQQAALLIQKYWNRFSVCRRIRRRFRESAICIQSVVRGWLFRKHFSALQHGVTSLQLHWLSKKAKARSIVLRSKRQFEQFVALSVSRTRELVAHHLAAQRIQSLFRRFRYRMRTRSQVLACIKLQSVFRGWILRKRLYRQKTAAVQISSWVRGYSSRRLRSLLDYAARSVQQRWRVLHDRREFLRTRALIILVQRTWKKHRLEAEFRQHHHSIVLAQSIVRGWLCRRVARRMQWVLIRVKAFCIGLCARRRFRKLHDAARKIQSIYRGVLSRRRLSARAVACLQIQRVWRGGLSCISIFLSICSLDSSPGKVERK